MANNAFFGIKYEPGKNVTTGHVLVIGGRGAASRAKEYRTQLLGTVPAPPFSRGYGASMSLSLRGEEVAFTIGKDSAKYGLARSTQAFPRIRPGLVLRLGGFELEKITIRGRLDPAWSKEETARLRKLLVPAKR